MDLAAVHLVTKHLHPQPSFELDGFSPDMIPVGLEELICRWGLGEFCSGLTIFTPAERRQRWPPSFIHEAIYKIYELGAWDPGVLELTDFTDCLVVADSMAGDIFVTCPRFGRTIFELPRLDSTIRVVGDSISALLEHYLRTHDLRFAYFDPGPRCNRRATIDFVVRPEIGLAQLDALLEETWGFAPRGSSSKSDTDYFQDRFIPQLQARVGLYLQEQQRPAGSITVTMTLDRELVTEVERFARPISLAENFHFQPNLGSACEHSQDYPSRYSD